VVPNVARAMLCASDSVGMPLTICCGRNSTRMSSSALTHDCAAMKCATATRHRPGSTIAEVANTAAMPPTAHSPNASSGGVAITKIALSASTPASASIATRADRAVGVTTSNSAPHSDVPM